jgi:hypothetical protein
MTKEVLERAVGCGLAVPARQKSAREACSCLLGNDIGMYNTCNHGCVYCYANYDAETVHRNVQQHDPKSPFLIGGHREGDRISDARQETYLDGQLSLFSGMGLL